MLEFIQTLIFKYKYRHLIEKQTILIHKSTNATCIYIGHSTGYVIRVKLNGCIFESNIQYFKMYTYKPNDIIRELNRIEKLL